LMAACILLADVKAVPVHAGAGLTRGLADDELSVAETVRLVGRGSCTIVAPG
jgi:hypothetical protein